MERDETKPVTERYSDKHSAVAKAPKRFKIKQLGKSNEKSD